jgi:hypothetical protein
VAVFAVEVAHGRSTPRQRAESVASPRVRGASRPTPIDEVLTIYTVHVGAEEAVLTAKVHPTPGQSGDELAFALEELDQRLRRELPEIGEVFIDVTAHRGGRDSPA